jgi:hypothetical protein
MKRANSPWSCAWPKLGAPSQNGTHCLIHVYVESQAWKNEHVTFFAKYFQVVNGNLCFMPNLIQIIIDVGMLGCRPYIQNELCYTFLKEFFQSKPKKKSVKWNKSSLMSNQRPHILNHLKIYSLEKKC